jgi:hypothetical protein
MQVIRRERLAKAKGLAMIGLMLLVAGTVHYWPRAGREAVAPRPDPPTVVGAAPAATAALRRAELQFRRPELQFVRVRPPAPESSTFTPDAVPVAPLSALPGTSSSLPEPSSVASFVPTLVPPLAPAPSALVIETRPVAPTQRPASALTVAAKATGKGLAVAFQKTGAAFRRVF